MIRNLLKFLFFIVLGVLVYNYFLGTEEEKANAKEVFGEVKDVVVVVKDLVESEKEKFDAGKYDNAIDKIGEMLSKLKQRAVDVGDKNLGRIQELEKKRNQLKEAISSYNHEDGRLDGSSKSEKKDTSDLKSEVNELLRETEKLIGDMELEEK